MLGSASPRNPSVSDGAEIVSAANLAGRVPLQTQPRIIRIHAVAVVFDANELLAAVFDGDGDARARPRRWRFRPAP